VKTWYGKTIAVNKASRNRLQFEKNRRRQHPVLRATKECHSATQIQKIFRRFMARARLPALFRERRAEERVRLATKCAVIAVRLQRVVRGNHARARCLERGRNQSQIVIAAWWRTFPARCYASSQRKRESAAVRIQQNLHRIMVFRRWKRMAKHILAFFLLEAPAQLIQRLVRMHRYRKECTREQLSLRRRAEEREFARQCVILCRLRARDVLSHESSGNKNLRGSIGREVWERALMIHADVLLAKKLIIIKNLGRRYLARRKLQTLRAASLQRRVDSESMLLIQKHARAFLARARGLKMARRAYVKYQSADNKEPYYSNQHTGEVFWAKPRLFGVQDIEEVITLDPGREFVVSCCMCRRQARRHCADCEAAFCDTCAMNQHRKGNRRKHSLKRIELCSMCCFQTATRFCATCMVLFGKPRSYLCDVCFSNTQMHRYETTLGAVKSGLDTRKSHRRRPHASAWLVVPCVEACQNAAKLWCKVCQDCFCSACFAELHRRGSKMYHGVSFIGFLAPDAKEEWLRSSREYSGEGHVSRGNFAVSCPPCHES